jgi:phage host-nuclease inhibitor protein Gam
MTKPKATKTKVPAMPVPQTPEECAQYVYSLGETDRRIQSVTKEVATKIAFLQASAALELEKLTDTHKGLAKGIQAYCEANRDKLTNGGKTKTIKFLTGEVNWKKRPPSVEFKRGFKLEEIIQKLKKAKFFEIIRTKEEVNKEALLELPIVIEGQPDGLTQEHVTREVPEIIIRRDVEDFNIVPSEVQVPPHMTAKEDPVGKIRDGDAA